MKKIEMPEWIELPQKYARKKDSYYTFAGDFVERTFKELYVGRYIIEPDDLVEVYASRGKHRSGQWEAAEIKDGSDCGEDRDEYTHKAFLIVGEPIKQESCRDVLFEVSERMELRTMHEAGVWRDLIDRAKAAIERESE